MPDDSQKDWREPLTPRDIELWARQEITDASRAHALRVKELTDIARACSSGEITALQADERHDSYYARWGDALPSISVGPHTTDEEIIQSLDDAAERRRAAIRTKSEGRLR